MIVGWRDDVPHHFSLPRSFYHVGHDRRPFPSQWVGLVSAREICNDAVTRLRCPHSATRNTTNLPCAHQCTHDFSINSGTRGVWLASAAPNSQPTPRATLPTFSDHADTKIGPFFAGSNTQEKRHTNKYKADIFLIGKQKRTCCAHAPRLLLHAPTSKFSVQVSHTLRLT